MANDITAISNGVGFLYVVNPDGVTINSAFANDSAGIGETYIRQSGSTSSPIAGEIAAIGTVTLGTADGTTTGLTVNGVSIITGTVAAQGSLALDADALRDNINATVSVPDYTAISNGVAVIISTVAGVGAGANGYAVACITAAGMTNTTTAMAGGSSGNGIYSTSVTGRRYFINATAIATATSLVGAVEITQYIVNRGLQNSSYAENLTIVSDLIAPTRVAQSITIFVETEGGAGTDNLKTITSTGFQNEDILIIHGVNAAHVVTVKSYVGGNDNIKLANGTDWSSGGLENVLALQYINTGSAPYWFELYRSPNLAITVANFRTSGLAEAVQGVNTTTLTNAGGTITLTAGTDKGQQKIVGSATLLASYNFALAASGIAGDEFWFDYRATMTEGGNTVTIGGITLTTAQALNAGGNGYTVRSVWNGSSWSSQIFANSNGYDIASKAFTAATYQPLLPLPASDGQVFVSTAAGVISTVPLGGLSPLILNIPYTAWQPNAGAAGTIIACTLPAGSNILLVKGKTIAAFAGGTTATATLTLNYGGVAYVTAFNIFAAVAATNGFQTGVQNTTTIPSQTATSNMTAVLTITGDVINNLTSGSFEVWIYAVNAI